jgi:hypothetical protein
LVETAKHAIAGAMEGCTGNTRMGCYFGQRMGTVHDAKRGLAVNLEMKIVLLLPKQGCRTYNPLLMSVAVSPSFLVYIKPTV